MTTVLCVDNLPVVVDLDDIRDACPPVLARFFGMVDGLYAEPPKDELGRLTFAKTFGITQKMFGDMIAFLRTGKCCFQYDTFHAFNVLGGCDAFDEFMCAQDARKEQENKYRIDMRERRQRNPLNKADDVYDMYKFEAHLGDWVHTEEWECCEPISGSARFWWRKRK